MYVCQPCTGNYSAPDNIANKPRHTADSFPFYTRDKNICRIITQKQDAAPKQQVLSAYKESAGTGILAVKFIYTLFGNSWRIITNTLIEEILYALRLLTSPKKFP